MHYGLPVDQLEQIHKLIVMNIMTNDVTEKATVVLTACGFAEKRGSIINGRGRLQRLNRAVRPPGEARDDWEILRDLSQAITGSNGIYTIEDVFKQMADSVPQLNGLSLSKIGDLGLKLIATPQGTTTPVPPGEPVDEKVFEREMARAPKSQALSCGAN